jgi:general stress protein YciG
MDFEKLVDKAKQVAERANDVVEQRGGAEALKEDAEELRDIARGDGGLVDKAKDAAEAVRDPGAPGQG